MVAFIILHFSIPKTIFFTADVIKAMSRNIILTNKISTYINKTTDISVYHYFHYISRFINKLFSNFINYTLCSARRGAPGMWFITHLD